MMKILHTSDWHLGHMLYDHDRTDEHASIMEQIISIAQEQQPDAVVVSGDVFDKSTPSQRARDLFISTLKSLRQHLSSAAIVVIAGNHDGKFMLDNDGKIFELGGINVIGQIHHKSDGTIDWNKHIIAVSDGAGELKGYIVAVPHIYDIAYPAIEGSAEGGDRMEAFYRMLFDHVDSLNSQGVPVVLSAHLFITGSDIAGHEATRYGDREIVGSCEAVAQERLGSRYDYLALGHIHKAQTVGHSAPMARYCGTPLPISFDEDGRHGVSLVEIACRGAVPTVSHIELSCPVPLITLPAEPAPFAKVLSELIAFPADQKAYLRLNVIDDATIPADYRITLSNLFNSKEAIYCTIKRTYPQHDDDADAEGGATTFSPEEMPSPLELAQLHFQKIYQRPMSDDLIALFKQAWDDVANSQEQQ